MGLLGNDWNDPRTMATFQMAAGLLGGGNFGQAASRGLSAYSDTMGEANKAAMLKEERDYIKQQRESKAAKDERDEAERIRLQGLIRGALGGATPQQAMGMGGQLGPTQAKQDMIGQRQPIDANALIAQGVPIETVKQLFEAQDFGRSEVARTVDTVDEQGRPTTMLLDKFGRPSGAGGLRQWKAPVSVNQGDRQTFIDPVTLQAKGSFGVNETPDGRASRAVTMRGQNMTDARARERLQFDQSRPTNMPGDRKPMTAAQEAKYRGTMANDYQAANTNLANMNEVLSSIEAVRNAPGLGGATGISAYLPSMPGGDAAAAEVKLKNLEGKITQLGKAAAAQGGAVGPMAVQEWKIVRDMIAAIEPAKGKKAMLEQIELIEQSVIGASQRIKETYEKQYSPDFEAYPQFQALRIPDRGEKASSGAIPLPSNPSASSLKRDTVYDTPRGPAKWDGMKFNPVK